MISPKRQQAKDELARDEICRAVFKEADKKLYMNFRYMRMAFSALFREQSGETTAFGTDGFHLYYHPDTWISMYRQGDVFILRGILHTTLHCILGHLDQKETYEDALWDLSCDIIVENILDALPHRMIHRPLSAMRREWYRKLKGKYPVLTAQRVYHFLEACALSDEECCGLRECFHADDHHFWRQKSSGQRNRQRKEKWDDIRQKMQTEMETIGKEPGDSNDAIHTAITVKNRRRYDYRKFLRRFSVLKEEVHTDPDSFDPVFYTYGLQLYRNMPLIEPNETREVRRIEDFVIVIDTSLSCKGELVCRFLEETYDILSQEESYFRKINLHIIQCDDQVRDDVRITDREQLQIYMEQFTVIGQGGTDFRPAFGYVNRLIAEHAFHHLRGLLYFTDGYGTFPLKRPLFDTAFIFWNEQYSDADVPPWAIRIVLTPEDLKEVRER